MRLRIQQRSQLWLYRRWKVRDCLRCTGQLSAGHGCVTLAGTMQCRKAGCMEDLGSHGARTANLPKVLGCSPAVVSD